MVTSHRPTRHRPRHRAPLHHRGRHRAAITVQLAPQGRYAVVLGAAVLSAGAVALGSAAALPSTQPEPPPIAGEIEARYQPPAAQRVPGAAVDVGTDERGGRTTDRDDSPLTEQPAETTWRLPLDDIRLTSLFGPRWGLLHQGIDFAAPHGAPVYAAQSGTVTEAGWHGGFGQLVVIDHGDGVSTYYAHNSVLNVTPGQQVQAGDHIADVGDTGDSYGPHSHFELHIDGRAVDPIGYLAGVGLDLARLRGCVNRASVARGAVIEYGKAEGWPHTGVVCGHTDNAAVRSVTDPRSRTASIDRASKASVGVRGGPPATSGRHRSRRTPAREDRFP